jgi:uncharacterized protein YbjT (DUF2867 family)
MSMILLTGATGNVTSAVIRSLQGSGHRLIGLVRDPAKAKDLAAQGVELRTGDLSLLRTVEGTFEGVDVAWLLTPPGPSAPIQASNALWAARLGGVKHVVRMSAVGAAHDAPNLNSRLHALSDAEIAGCGLSFTVVKPHFFMQNLMMAGQSVAEQGTIYFALGDAKLPMVDVRDIGTSVAVILANPAPHAGKTYTLTGPTAIGIDQVASALGEVLGKPVKYVPVPVAAMVESLTKMGLDDYNQVALRDYFTAYSRGWESQVTSAVKGPHRDRGARHRRVRTRPRGRVRQALSTPDRRSITPRVGGPEAHARRAGGRRVQPLSCLSRDAREFAMPRETLFVDAAVMVDRRDAADSKGAAELFRRNHRRIGLGAAPRSRIRNGSLRCCTM